MKKDLFDFLNTDLQFVKGVGPKVAARFDDVIGGRRVLDFLLHRPSAVRPWRMPRLVKLLPSNC